MDLNPQGLVSGEGEVEALALVLRALTGPSDPARAYDDFCACLGVSAAPVAVSGEVRPQDWPAYGRDHFLERVARAYGLRLRNLHPPDVGADMARAEEFDQHFELSYKPLICRAIENGQPVIAWRGWDGEEVPSWGILTDIVDNAFAGRMAISGESTGLSAPAWQCYVVETREPAEPSRDSVLEMALRFGAAMLRGDSAGPPGHPPRDRFLKNGVAVGVQAWSVWRDRIARADAANDTASKTEGIISYSSMARYLLCSRRSAMRFWERMLGHEEGHRAAPLQKLVAGCSDTVSVIERLVDLTGGRQAGKPSQALSECLAVLDEAGRLEERLLGAFDEACREMSILSKG